MGMDFKSKESHCEEGGTRLSKRRQPCNLAVALGHSAWVLADKDAGCTDAPELGRRKLPRAPTQGRGACEGASGLFCPGPAPLVPPHAHGHHTPAPPIRKPAESLLSYYPAGCTDSGVGRLSDSGRNWFCLVVGGGGEVKVKSSSLGLKSQDVVACFPRAPTHPHSHDMVGSPPWQNLLVGTVHLYSTRAGTAGGWGPWTTPPGLRIWQQNSSQT